MPQVQQIGHCAFADYGSFKGVGSLHIFSATVFRLLGYRVDGREASLSCTATDIPFCTMTFSLHISSRERTGDATCARPVAGSNSPTIRVMTKESRSQIEVERLSSTLPL